MICPRPNPRFSPRLHRALDALSDALAEVNDAALDEVASPGGFLRGLAFAGLAFTTRRRFRHLIAAHGPAVDALAPIAAE